MGFNSGFKGLMSVLDGHDWSFSLHSGSTARKRSIPNYDNRRYIRDSKEHPYQPGELELMSNKMELR
jgi:hypothetical protein